MTKISNQYSLTNVLFADTTNGRVGIGTESPSAPLHVFSSSSVTAVFTRDLTTDVSLRILSDNSGAILDTQGVHNLRFQTSDTERMRITSAGKVGINNNTPTAKFEVLSGYDPAGFFKCTNNEVPLSVINTENAVACIGFRGSTSANEYNVRCGANGENLVFYTSNTEKMRITSGGNVGIGTTSPNSKLQIGSMVAYTGSGYTFAMGNGTTDFLITVNAAQTGSSVTFYSSTDYFFNRSGPSSTGIISAYGFNNVSDYRLKYNLEQFDGLSLVSQIKTYKYKMEETHETQYGVLAHEIQEILPHLVVGEKDGDRMQSVDYQKIVPMLIKSVQEQQTQINELKALINA
jgi:hypothetical protein